MSFQIERPNKNLHFRLQECTFVPNPLEIQFKNSSCHQEMCLKCCQNPLTLHVRQHTSYWCRRTTHTGGTLCHIPTAVMHSYTWPNILPSLPFSHSFNLPHSAEHPNTQPAGFFPQVISIVIIYKDATSRHCFSVFQIKCRNCIVNRSINPCAPIPRSLLSPLSLISSGTGVLWLQIGCTIARPTPTFSGLGCRICHHHFSIPHTAHTKQWQGRDF